MMIRIIGRRIIDTLHMDSDSGTFQANILSAAVYFYFVQDDLGLP